MDRIIITKLAELNLDFREHFPLLFESEPAALFNDMKHLALILLFFTTSANSEKQRNY